MSKGALYHYVGSKEDILSLAIEDASARQARMLDSLSAEVAYADSADALKQTVRAYLRLIDQQYDALRVLDQEAPTIPPYYRTKVFNNAIYVRQFMEGVIQKGVDSGQFKVENVSYAAYLVCVACLAWTGRRWLLGKRYSLADYVQEATASAMKIVRA
jgi:AcrR family transcriptional regulator